MNVKIYLSIFFLSIRCAFVVLMKIQHVLRREVSFSPLSRKDVGGALYFEVVVVRQRVDFLLPFHVLSYGNLTKNNSIVVVF